MIHQLVLCLHVHWIHFSRKCQQPLATRYALPCLERPVCASEIHPHASNALAMLDDNMATPPSPSTSHLSLTRTHARTHAPTNTGKRALTADVVRLAERHALAHQVLGKVRREHVSGQACHVGRVGQKGVQW
jgi:hypothetical protein